MKEIAFSELGIQPHIETKIVKFNDKEIEVCNYIPVEEKTRLLQFVVNGALDETTGTFSPLRVEVYYAVAVCRWYAGITFSEEDMRNITMVYDALDTSGFITSVVGAIPEDEIGYLNSLIKETLDDIAKYNTSAAGIIQSMSSDAGNLDEQLSDILQKVKNGEGLEQLSVIKDVVGKD